MNSRIRNFEDIDSRLRIYFSKSNEYLIDHYQETNANKYPLLKYVLGKGNPLKALISAGIHGDEPGGVEAICTFLESNIFKHYSVAWEITFLPCLNPYGYEYGIRENHEGKDLNRLFKDGSPPEEVKFAKSIFDKRFDLTIELHEDYMSPGYYLYHKGTQANDDLLSKNIIQSVKNIMSINMDSQIDGYSALEGVISPDGDFRSMDWWPMAIYSFSKNSRRCLTLETATNFPMDIRIEAHLRAMDTALSFFLSKA